MAEGMAMEGFDGGIGESLSSIVVCACGGFCSTYLLHTSRLGRKYEAAGLCTTGNSERCRAKIFRCLSTFEIHFMFHVSLQRLRDERAERGETAPDNEQGADDANPALALPHRDSATRHMTYVVVRICC